MVYSGVIFDFNGTLFWDSEKHDIAWKAFSKELRGCELTDGELKKYVHGRTNKLILEYIVGEELDIERANYLASEKERVYRELCIKDKENFKLAPGAVELLDYLKEKDIAINIATASDNNNVGFFIESFNLDKWFDINKIVYDDGNIKSKPNPDIYLKAIEKIGLKSEQCIVFEDAMSGIEAAHRAKVGKVFAIASQHTREELDKLSNVDYVINDFSNFPRNILD
ncbi:HAD family hydrolase [Clostridium tarantellae]|uniref:HAD-IA family hydrolase n=1 Tax=Clostridium tarantellae TaxID=39493 RepID=A0A6I1MQT8_9CLOT|nr:HAD family phosphatase [Clostridium tarantellae]MPQ44602.1 HAD-IA family hydrolase [Clostridium tarantellae]